MVSLKLITAALESGARYRMKFSGKQLEALPEHLKPLIKDIKDPVVHVGINGRGAEGSMYGVKVFAKGSKDPVAAAAGRVDYREADPILQLRTFARKNRGEGEALRANVMLDTGKPFNIEAMDDLAIHKAKNVYTVQARSNFANADIKVDRPATEEIARHMGIRIPTTAKLQKLLETARTGIKTGFNTGNPYKVEQAAAQSAEASKVTEKVACKTDDIDKFLKATSADRNAKALADAKKDLVDVEKSIAELKNEFKACKFDDQKAKIAKEYEKKLECLKKIQDTIKYFES